MQPTSSAVIDDSLSGTWTRAQVRVHDCRKFWPVHKKLWLFFASGNLQTQMLPAKGLEHPPANLAALLGSRP